MFGRPNTPQAIQATGAANRTKQQTDCKAGAGARNFTR